MPGYSGLSNRPQRSQTMRGVALVYALTYLVGIQFDACAASRVSAEGLKPGRTEAETFHERLQLQRSQQERLRRGLDARGPDAGIKGWAPVKRRQTEPEERNSDSEREPRVQDQEPDTVHFHGHIHHSDPCSRLGSQSQACCHASDFPCKLILDQHNPGHLSIYPDRVEQPAKAAGTR